MAVLKKIKFGESTNNIQFTEVKPANGGVITATGAHTDLSDGDNPEYVVDLTIADDGTLVKDNGALKVGTVPAAQVSVAAGGHDASAEEPDSKTFVGDDVEKVLLELNQKIEQTGNAARTYTLVDDTKNVQDLPSNVAKRYRLQETIGTQNPTLVGANIDIPKDSSLKEVYLGSKDDTINTETGVITKQEVTDPQSMNFAYQLANGTYSLVKIDVSKFLTESEFGDGLAVSGEGVVSVKVDSTSESFLSVGTNGVKLSGVQDAINSAIDALDVDDTAETGKYVSSVDETNGKVLTTKANVSDAVLNGYAKGTKPESTEITANDDVKGAIAKLEHQVDNAKAEASAAIDALDFSDTEADGQYVSKVDETDGKISVERKDVSGAPLNGYAKGKDKLPLAAGDTINQAFSKIEVTIEANEHTTAAALTDIDNRIKGMDKAADAADGQVVTTVSEENGVVSETKAYVKDLELGGYEKDASAKRPIGGTDTINTALSKLENAIDAAKAAATTKVEKDANASHLTLANSTAADGSVTYTIGESDIASKTALDAEIAARKAVDGQSGQTYAANGSAKYISGATSLNDADVKLDAALKGVSDKVDGIKYNVSGTTLIISGISQDSTLS